MYGKLFAHRAVLSFLLVMMLLLSCVLRVAVVATDDYKQIQAGQTAYRIEVARLRGTIYDCNMVPITNSTPKTVAAVAPTPKGIMAISTALNGEALQSVLETLKNNMPAVCTVNEKIKSEGVATTLVYNHIGENLPACHIVGYTDSTGHGVTGIQKAYDDLLYSEKNVSAVFTADGKGNVLAGIEPYFENDLSVVHSGVVTTLDVNVQAIAEEAVSALKSGCAVVAEASSGKIRAMASVPTFDISDLSKSLTQDNSPMLNRALSAFNVGSVFKPCVAAAAFENGYSYHTFNCEGSLEIVDRVFRCHKLSGHGNMDMCDALSQSCNCFFYNLAITLGGTHIYKTASALSLSTEMRIADNLYTASGSISTEKSLLNEGALANLSIGQGNLMASPVSMLNLYTAIATDGSYYLPSIVEKTISDGKETLYDKGYKTRVMRSDTASVLREYLETVITDGTGKEAAPKSCTAAGKTATAQTGRYYENGEEITNSWFCGFFPAENPEYVVVVMSDSKLNVSTASIFAKIADGITELNGKNVEIAD
ncbi:MAG: penicillin-binding protein 2 [Clostridia bacterium]|nr:penicillin-binding protein 2 [Clostridia bacterium]